MATLEQIAEALRRADAAGNVEDAKALANAYRQMQSGTAAATGGGPLPFNVGSPERAELPVPGETQPLPVPVGHWQRGMLAPIEIHSTTKEMRPAVPQAAIDVWNAVTLPGEVARGETPFGTVSWSEMPDEYLDRAANLSGMVTPGKVRQPGGLIAPDGQVAPSQFATAVSRDGLTAADLNAVGKTVGTGGVAADLGPALQGLAMGVARTPGEGQSQLMNYLRTRAFEARERIQPQVDNILGPSLSTGQFAGNIRDLKSATSPLYKSAFDNAAPVNTAPITAALDGLIGQSVGAGKSRLQAIKAMFAGESGPINDPRILFAIRNEIDDMLDSPDIGRIAESLKAVRNSVDSELAAKVPGIKDADARWQEIARQQEGFDEGRKIFQQGENAVDPRDLGPRLEQGVIPKGVMIGPSGETFALTQGGRNELDRLIGTGSQNRTNLATAIRGDGSWNRQKLVQLYGEEKADQLIRLFDNEARMAETERMAVGSSITSSAAAAQKALEPQSAKAPVLGGPFIVDPGNAARRIAEALIGNTAEASANTRNQRIAELLMQRGGWYENKMTSPEQLAVVRALLMTSNIYGEDEEAR